MKGRKKIVLTIMENIVYRETIIKTLKDYADDYYLKFKSTKC